MLSFGFRAGFGLFLEPMSMDRDGEEIFWDWPLQPKI